MQGVEECGEWQESWEDFWVGPKGGRDLILTFTKSKVLLPCQKERSHAGSDPASSVSVRAPSFVALPFSLMVGQFNGWTK